MRKFWKNYQKPDLTPVKNRAHNLCHPERSEESETTDSSAFGLRMTRAEGFRVTIVTLCMFLIPSYASAEPDPAKLLEQMDYVLRGPSHEMSVTLNVKTKRWERHYKIKVWMKGVDFAFARVLEPPKSEGQGFLRIKTRLWHYLPTAERTILIPPSLMLDDFLGSDFSNDDFVKLSYLARDYDGKIIGEEKMDDFDAYHLELTPHSDAPVTYGKLEVWVRKNDSAPVRSKFYNEKLEHIRTLHYSVFRKFGDHEVPTVWFMENHKDRDRQTTIKILNAEYGININDSFFNRKDLEKYP